MKTAIRNLLTDYYRADYFVRLQATFRISELTSNVPFAVRSAFRNDNIEDSLDTNNKKNADGLLHRHHEKNYFISPYGSIPL